MELKSPYVSAKTVFSTISSSDRFKSFLQILIKEHDCRIANFIYRADSYARYLNPDRKFDYITFREKKGLISFQPAGREQKYNDEGKWARDGRQEIKPAKFAKEFLHPRLIAKFKDHEIAAFATRFKAFEESRMIDFEVVEIEEAYNSSKYESDIGSCMADKNVAPFYHSFGTKAVVAKRKNGKLCGRALLWTNVEIKDEPEPQTFMDRIYTANLEVAELFLQWVKDKKYWYKDGQNNQSWKTYINPQGKKVDTTLVVRTIDGKTVDGLEFYPYLDTLFYGDDNYSITNTPIHVSSEDESVGSFASYRQTSGARRVDISYSYVTDYQGNRLCESDAVRMNDGQYYSRDSDLIVLAYNEHGLADNRFHADCFMGSNGCYYTLTCKGVTHFQDHKGDWCHENDIVSVDDIKYYRYGDEVVHCAKLDCYILKENAVAVNFESVWAWTEGLENYYMPKDAPGFGQCAMSGLWYEDKLLVIDNDGKRVYIHAQRDADRKREKLEAREKRRRELEYKNSNYYGTEHNPYKANAMKRMLEMIAGSSRNSPRYISNPYYTWMNSDNHYSNDLGEVVTQVADVPYEQSGNLI